MDTLDLDAIIHSVYPNLSAGPNESPNLKKLMQKVIHETLVLASESAKLEIEYYKSVTMHNRTGIDIKYDDSKHFAEKVFVDKQSILDVELLIK